LRVESIKSTMRSLLKALPLQSLKYLFAFLLICGMNCFQAYCLPACHITSSQRTAPSNEQFASEEEKSEKNRLHVYGAAAAELYYWVVTLRNMKY